MTQEDQSGSRCLYEDDEMKLIHRPGSSEYALASFSNFGFSPDGLSFWGQKLCDTLDIETLGFVAKRPNWFPVANMACALAHRGATGNRPLITYGHSQGAYAALKYAAALHADAVIASAPQYSIDPSIILHDRRFTSHFRKSLHLGMEISNADQAGHVYLVYDPYDTNDAEHINFIEKLGYQPTTHLPIYHLGHEMMEVLSQRHVILELIRCARSGDGVRQLRLLANKSKRQSMRFGLTFAEQLLRKGKTRASRHVLDNAFAKAKGALPEPILRKRDELYRKLARIIHDGGGQHSC